MSRRFVASVLLATALLASPSAHARGNAGALERARVFDQAGVKAYTEGRFREAIVLFEEAFFEGGPPSELWNEAKCWLRLDDGPQAAKALRRYLGESGLPADEKAEAERLLDEIQRRPSSLTVATTPSGAVVRLDDRVVGVSPLTTSVTPGKHALRLEHTTAGTYDTTVEARDGQGIAFGIDLEHSAEPPPDLPVTPHGPKRAAPVRRWSVELAGLASVAMHSAGPGSVFPGVSLAGTFTIVTTRSVLFGAGLRFVLTGDAWSTTAGTPNVASPCTLPGDYASAEVFFTPLLFAAFRIGSAVSLAARAGFGFSALTASELGGDLFNPTCGGSPGLSPNGYAGLDVSVRLTPAVRAMVVPITLDIHPAYAGARTTPIDASGAWARLGFGLGVGVDF